MKKILQFGAGKSSTYLTKYLLENAEKYDWELTVIDINTNHLKELFSKNLRLICKEIDIQNDPAARQDAIEHSDLVLSLLPPNLHIIVARDCVWFKKDLITASYVSDEMKALHDEVKANGSLFMCEMGLDPGIDHMSAMEIIEGIEKAGGDVYEFKSHCGGLVAPESDTNPFHYKISWNPRNVVNAGKAGAHYLLKNKEVRVAYENIFENSNEISVANIGKLAYYPNRDSLHYKNIYGLNHVNTLIRTTLRYPIFNKIWHIIIAIGITDEDDKMNTSNLTYLDWVAKKLTITASEVPKKLNELCKADVIHIAMLEYLNLLSTNKINIGENKSSADILQTILEAKLAMIPTDKDMIVMQHEFKYTRKKVDTYIKSTLIVKGENRNFTAMAKTVGLPMAILAKLLLTDKIKDITGVQIPTMKQVYKPVLKELKQLGIAFNEEVK